MAYSYQTGSVNGLQALFDSVVSFLTGTAGWTLLDTLSTGDKVIQSSGSSGKDTLIYRLTMSRDAGNPYKWGLYYWQDAVIVRGYMTWDTVGHTGTMRYGKWGPLGVWQCSYGSSPYIVRFAMLSDDPTLWPTQTNTEGSFLASDGNYFILDHDERASFVLRGSGGGQGFSPRDVRTGDAWTGAGAPDGNACLTYSTQCRTFSSTGDEVYYSFMYGNGQFQSYNQTTNAWTICANPPWGTPGTSMQGTLLVWDGADSVYCVRGNTTTLAKYSIGGNSWTTLTAAPAVRAQRQTQPGCGLYIPAAASGRTSDVIICTLTDSNATLYMYDITAATWSSFGVPFSHDGNASLVWDNEKYLYYFNTFTSNNWYMMDVSKLSGTISWTAIGLLNYSNGSQVYGSTVMNTPTASVFTSKLTATTYYILADANSFFVGTSENNRDHWMYCGMYDSNYVTTKATTTASISPGFVVSVPVDSSASLSVGDVVNISGGGSSTEQITILSIPDGTHFTANILKLHGSGARVGVDVAPYVCTSGHGLSSLPLDTQGYLTDRITASFFTMPLLPQTSLNMTSPTGRGYYQLSPLMIYQNRIAKASHQDTVGTLKNVFAIYRSGVSSGDTITIRGKNYIVLTPYATSKQAATNYCGFAIAFGPTN